MSTSLVALMLFLNAEPIASASRHSVSELRKFATSAEVQSQECGYRCIALMLAMHSIAFDRDELHAGIAITHVGSSMSDLRKAAAARGLVLRATHATPRTIGRLQLPAIAQLEPTSHAAINHFVILLDVDDTTAAILDPNDKAIHRLDVKQFAGKATGYYLERDSWDRMVPPIALISLWVSITGFAVMWARRGGIFTRLRMIAATVMLAAFGCGHEQIEPPESSRTLLGFDSSVVPIGAPKERTVTAQVKFQNRSNRDLVLTSGPHSCSCLGVEFAPSNRIKKGGSATAMITVRIAGKPPGPILDSTRIVVEEFHEVQDIVIAGLVEGITASPSSYAIRPAHLEAKQIPALRLIGFTESPRSELEIDEVTANQPNVTFHLDQSRRLKPLAIEPLGTRREWTIPVTVESPIRSGNFTITVGYRLNQGDRQLVHVDANILTK